MKTYDVTCPFCGHKNEDLYLEETEGWMECEECGSVSVVSIPRAERKSALRFCPEQITGLLHGNRREKQGA